MARTIQISALNIAMGRPHSPDRYIKMLRDAYSARYVVQKGSLNRVMIGSLHFEDRSRPEQGLTGELFLFVKLDPTEPWFNTETQEAASEQDVDLINIPGHLLPHLRRLPFFFLPEKHSLWYVAKDRNASLSARNCERVFQAIVDNLEQTKGYPPTEVTAFPAANALHELLSLPSLEKLFIDIKRPNSDDGRDEEARVLKKLERQNAKRLKLELVSEANQSLEPDSETKELADVASRNGAVRVIGRDSGGEKVDSSTLERPFVQPALVDEELETVFDVLKRNARVG